VARILLLGSTGFFGRGVAHKLIGGGHQLRVLVPDRMKAAGIDADRLASGCCGLAGNFGFEKDHYAVSRAAGERVLLPRVRAADAGTQILADGFSCRTQIRQGDTGRSPLHLAQLLASRAPLALAATKRVMMQGAHLPISEALDVEQREFIALFGTEDAAEGISAFLQKRQADWKGR